MKDVSSKTPYWTWFRFVLRICPYSFVNWVKLTLKMPRVDSFDLAEFAVFDDV
jgi:hypothetical protein